MGLFDKIEKIAKVSSNVKEKLDDQNNAQPVSSAKAEDTSEAFVRTYTNMNTFRGTRRLIISSYEPNDKYGAMANGMKLLGSKEQYGCVGREITLTGISYDNKPLGNGIRVSVDGLNVGVVWNHDANDAVYAAAYEGNIEGVYVRFEREFVSDLSSGKSGDRAKGYLFVKMTE